MPVSWTTIWLRGLGYAKQLFYSYQFNNDGKDMLFRGCWELSCGCWRHPHPLHFSNGGETKFMVWAVKKGGGTFLAACRPLASSLKRQLCSEPGWACLRWDQHIYLFQNSSRRSNNRNLSIWGWSQIFSFRVFLVLLYLLPHYFLLFLNHNVATPVL